MSKRIQNVNARVQPKGLSLAPTDRPGLRVGLRRWRNGLAVASVIWAALAAFQGLSQNEIGCAPDIHDGQE